MEMGQEPKHSAFFKTSSCSDRSKVFPGGRSGAHTHAVLSKMQSKYRYLQLLISLLLATNYTILNKTYLFSHVTQFELKFYILRSLRV